MIESIVKLMNNQSEKEIKNNEELKTLLTTG